MPTNVQIQVRMGSSRLPGKAMLPIGGRHLIEWVVSRCAESDEPDDVVVCHGDRPENDVIAEFCERRAVSHVAGAEEDLLARHHNAARRFDADPVVRICGDSPVVPPAEIDRVIRVHRENDADCTSNVSDAMARGIAVDVIDTEVLSALRDRGETHPVAPLRRADNEWHVAETVTPRWSEFADVDLSVDTPGDYWRMRDAFEAVGCDPLAVADWFQTRHGED